ncbi:hypothetical protein ECEC4436_2780, partial [Escherichia coli EC4436]
MVDVSEI